MAKKKLTLEDMLVPVEEIPYEIPENWCWVRFEHLVKDTKLGLVRSVKQQSIDYEYNYLKMNNITNSGDIDLNGIVNVNADRDEIEVYSLKKGDFLFNTRNSKELVGKNTVVKEDFQDIMLFNNNIMRVKFHEGINPQIVSSYLNSPMGQRKLDEIKRVTTNIAAIYAKDLNKILIPIPPLAEQERIVSRIESLFDKVDRAAELVEEARDGFEKRRAAILEMAFSGELTKKWREENLNIISIDERLESIKGERLSVCQSKKEISDINKMFAENNFIDEKYPEGWMKLKSNMICHNIVCGKTPTGNIVESEEIPYLKVYNIVNNKIDFQYKPQFIDRDTLETKLKNSILKPNDVIMNIVGPPLRKIAIIPNDYPYWGMNQAIVRFRTISKVLPKYLYYCLLNEDTLKDVINETRGVVGQANISVSQSRNLDIPVPTFEEQVEIVKILDRLLDNEDIIEERTDLSETIDSIKKSILAKAFRGELGSNDFNEESSIELLKELIK